VSIKGKPYAWFRAALERGDLLAVRAAAAELPRIDLADAAAVVALMASSADPAFERAAVKWVARLATERPYLALEDLADVVSALVALPHAVAARERLAELCCHLGMGELVGVAPSKRTGPQH
jgi:hypothetical protein